MMIYATMEARTEFYPVGCLFQDEAAFCAALKNPETLRADDVIVFRVVGADYAERKESLRELAQAFQAADNGGLSWGELAMANGFFLKHGKRYGLLREFEENGIC